MRTRNLLIIITLIISAYIIISTTLQDLQLETGANNEEENNTPTIQDPISGLKDQIPEHTRTEELRITTTSIINSTTAKLYVKNTGSADVTVLNILINGRTSNNNGWTITDTVLISGEEAIITITAEKYPITSFSSGLTYEFIVNTEGGTYTTTTRAP
jgi:hypothetical protein